MKALATIPVDDGAQQFEGHLIPLEQGEVLSFLHLDHRKLAEKAITLSGIETGQIPVMTYDEKNNFAAFTLEVSGKAWRGTMLDGYTNSDGKWTSLSKEATH